MRRSRIALIGLLMAGCGVQQPAPPAAGALPSAAAVTARPAYPVMPIDPANPPATPRLPLAATATPAPAPYPGLDANPPTLAAYPPFRSPTPTPAPPTAVPISGERTPRLPTDRIWIDSDQLLAIDATGAAEAFALPPEIAEDGQPFRLEWYIKRPRSTPLGVAYDESHFGWQLVDPATGASLKLPFDRDEPPIGLGGADPNLILLQTAALGPDDPRELALVNLERREVTQLGRLDLLTIHSYVAAWRYPYAYLVNTRPADDPDGPAELWQIDLSQSPPSSARLLDLKRAATVESDQATALLVQKEGSEQVSLVDLATGARQDLPIPILASSWSYPLGALSPDGALIAFMRLAGDGTQELAVYERATGALRVPLAGLRLPAPAAAMWSADGESLLVLPRRDSGLYDRFTAIHVRLDGAGGPRSMELEDVREVAPLGDDHLVFVRGGWLEAPALDGGPPLFDPLPVQGAYSSYLIVHVP